MSHKNKTLYWHLFLVKDQDKAYTTDFECAMLNQMAVQFQGVGGFAPRPNDNFLPPSCKNNN
jgi:hypothetical protein